MKKILIPFLTALWACGGGVPPASEVQSYLEALPSWPAPEADADGPSGEPFAFDEVDEGVLYTCTETPYDITRTPEKLVTYNPGADVFWPGVLLQGRGYRGGAGSFVELPIRKRAPLAVSIDLLFGGNTRTVERPDLASVNQAVGEIIESARDAHIEPQSSVVFDEVVSHSVEQTAISLGLSARYLSFSAKARLAASREANRTTITASFTQRAFTVSVVPPETPAGFFSPDFTRADLDQQIALDRLGPDNLPVYLASVSYGRVLLFSFTAEATKSEIVGALNVMADTLVASGSVDLSARQREILSSAEISVFTMGGDDDAALALIRSGDLRDYFAKDTTITAFAPISYVLRNVGDNSIALVSETTEYTVKSCAASTAGEIPEEGLRVEYLFNESERIPGNPGATPNSAPTGSSLDGVIENGCRVSPTADRFGYADQAYDFFGASGCSSAEPSLISVEAAGYTDALTFALWVTPGVNGGFLLGQSSGPHLEMNPDRVVSFVVPNGPTLSDGVPLEDSEWTFFAATAEPTADGVRMVLYRDGLEVARETGEALGVDWLAPTLIGNARRSGRDHDFQGKLDDIRVYDRALTADELAILNAEASR